MKTTCLKGVSCSGNWAGTAVKNKKRNPEKITNDGEEYVQCDIMLKFSFKCKMQQSFNDNKTHFV